MVEVDEERFAALVEEAYAGLPAELVALLDNVALFIDDEAPTDAPDLLGLYEGIPLTERDTAYAGALPDRITVFRGPILAVCASEEDVVREVGITVAHEVAHHFGIDDDRLHELGYA